MSVDIYPVAIELGFEPDRGHFILRFSKAGQPVGIVVDIGTAAQAFDLLQRLIVGVASFIAPDDASAVIPPSALLSVPTPRDVFGGERR